MIIAASQNTERRCTNGEYTASIHAPLTILKHQTPESRMCGKYVDRECRRWYSQILKQLDCPGEDIAL
jgi:hypothetical protein